MNHFINDFRDFGSDERCRYAGVEKLLNGEAPKVFTVVCTDEVLIDVVLAGSEDRNDTIVSLIYTDEAEIQYSWIIQLPGYNMCHIAIADSIATNIQENLPFAPSTAFLLESILEDYGMIRI